MKTILSVMLIVGLMLGLLALPPGCAEVEQREWKVVDGQNFLVRETKYGRLGDQSLQGLRASRSEPNGVTIEIALESQVSEGKLQIEGIILALAELAANLTGQGLIAEAGQVMGISAALQGAQAATE